jgi:hypothetical protein
LEGVEFCDGWSAQIPKQLVAVWEDWDREVLVGVGRR